MRDRVRAGRGPAARRSVAPVSPVLVLAVLTVVALALSPLPARAQPNVDGGGGPPEPPSITALGAVLWDPAEERVLWGRAEDEARMMASTTKVMTVLLALEAGTVDDTLTVSARAAGTGGASLGLRAGQRIPMRSVLAGLVLRSGNDAAVAVAEHIAGSEAAFVDRMNARAAALGLDDTNFLNASGLTDDPGHHASPLDLARLTEVAMADVDFAGWAGAARLTVPGLPPMTNRNELLGRFPGATGVKTGFTELSRYALVASARRDGWDLYAVVLGSEENFGDAAALLEYGYDAFRRVRVLDEAAEATRYRWSGAAVGLTAGAPLHATVGVEDRATWRTVLRPAVALPVAAGERLGTAELLVDGAVTDRVPLVAAADVAEPPAARGPGGVAGAALADTLRAFARVVAVERATD